MGLGVELRLELVARAAHPVLALFVGVFRVGVPALNHEPRDDAVKERLVVEARLRQRDEVFDMLGGQVWKELDLYLAEFGLDDIVWRHFPSFCRLLLFTSEDRRRHSRYQ